MAKPTKLPEWDNTETNSIEPDTDHKNQGWLSPGGIPEKPPFQTFNFWQNSVWKWLKEINTKGVLQYDPVTDYIADASYVVGSDGKLYQCLINNGDSSTPVNPVADASNTWKCISHGMTTRGDISVQGSISPQRLAAAAIGQVFKSRGEGNFPIWEKPSISESGFKIGETIWTFGDGTQNISGLGFEPKLVIFFAMEYITNLVNMSFGFDDGVIMHKSLGIHRGATTQNWNSSRSIFLDNSTGVFATGYISSINSGGFDITWEADFDVRFIYLAFG